jgi:hypothetical protein
VEQSNIDVLTMLTSMRSVFNTAAISVRVAGRETLSGAVFSSLLDLDVSDCQASVSAQQISLFANRNDVEIVGVVVYFVRRVATSAGSDIGSHRRPGRLTAVDLGRATRA